jgi:predicted acetyltransferase
MMTRTDPEPSFWDQSLEHRDNRTTYVQVYQDPVNEEAGGYLTFRFPTDGDTGRVGEFFANTPSAYRGLLSVLHYYGTQVRKVWCIGPADAPLPLYVMHNDLETAVSPLFMGRIVDIAAAFTALRTDSRLSGQVILKVTDDHADWNQQTIAIEMDDGRVTAKAVRGEPGISLDIQTLSQAYWGQPSLDQLRAGGRVSVADEAQYTFLARLLPSSICYLQDGF